SGLVELQGAPIDPGALDELCRLARYESLHLKVSPHVLANAERLGHTPVTLLRHLADAFGATRMMWSSDWPNAGRPYGDLVREGLDATELLDDDERAAFMGGTAVTLWPELAG